MTPTLFGVTKTQLVNGSPHPECLSTAMDTVVSFAVMSLQQAM
jgi:hypothetical protein